MVYCFWLIRFRPTYSNWHSFPFLPPAYRLIGDGAGTTLGFNAYGIGANVSPAVRNRIFSLVGQSIYALDSRISGLSLEIWRSSSAGPLIVPP